MNAAAMRFITNSWSSADILIIGQTSKFNGNSVSGGFITSIDNAVANCISKSSLSTSNQGNSGLSITTTAIRFTISSGSLAVDSLPLVRRD